MKKLIFILATMLFVALNCLYVCVPVKAETQKKLLALGDSITYGFKVKNHNSYIKMFVEKYEYNFTDYSALGMDSYDMIDLLDTIDFTDDYSMITLWIGANDMLGCVSTSIADEGIRLNNLTISDISKLNTLFNSETFKNKMTNVINNYKTNITTIVNKIKASSNAKLFVFTQYSPYYGIKIPDYENQTIFDASEISNYWVEQFNDIIREINDVKIVETYTEFQNEKGLTNVEMDLLGGNINIDPHPTLKGQETIFKLLDKKYLEQFEEERTLNIQFVALVIFSSVVFFATMIYLISIIKLKLKK